MIPPDAAEPPGPGAQLQGKTMRDVLAEAAAKGLTVLPNGNGVARVQYPRCGRYAASGGTHSRPVFAMTFSEILSGVILDQPLAPELANLEIAGSGVRFAARGSGLPLLRLLRQPRRRRALRQDAVARGAVAVVSNRPLPRISPRPGLKSRTGAGRWPWPRAIFTVSPMNASG